LRKGLTTGDEFHTAAHVIETDAGYFVGRGRLGSATFTENSLHTDIEYTEIIGEVTEEEYIGPQIAERQDGEWHDVDLSLDPDFDTNPPEARIFQYQGSPVAEFADIENPEAEEYLENYLEQ